MYKILIVEDDTTIARLLSNHLNGWGYECVCVTDFKSVTAVFAAEKPQLILLDISLPYYNGYYWCTEIRKLSQVPIIFISSSADNMSIVMAVNMGGDDFVAKPFDIGVLAAKVQAVMRRTYNFTSANELIEHKGMILNISDSTLSYGDRKTELNRNEFRILRTLFEQRGRIVSREKLMLSLWETDNFVDENTLNVNIARLRKRLSGMGMDSLIATKKGEGYIVE